MSGFKDIIKKERVDKLEQAIRFCYGHIQAIEKQQKKEAEEREFLFKLIERRATLKGWFRTLVEWLI